MYTFCADCAHVFAKKTVSLTTHFLVTNFLFFIHFYPSPPLDLNDATFLTSIFLFAFAFAFTHLTFDIFSANNSKLGRCKAHSLADNEIHKKDERETVWNVKAMNKVKTALCSYLLSVMVLFINDTMALVQLTLR